jgi:hypothetical protein
VHDMVRVRVLSVIVVQLVTQQALRESCCCFCDGVSGGMAIREKKRRSIFVYLLKLHKRVR